MVYMFLAEGFEEVEAIAPLDLLRRAGVSVMTIGVGAKVVRGAHGMEIIADITTYEAMKLLEKSPADMVILPGGGLGTENLSVDPTVKAFIDHAHSNGKYIAAICAAPSVLGKYGILKGKRATCFPGFEDKLDGAILSDEKVVADGRIITAKGMGVAVQFGLALVSALVSKERADELYLAIQA